MGANSSKNRPSSMMNCDQATRFTWRINDFRNFYASKFHTSDFSNRFKLSNLPSVKFSLFYDRNNSKLIRDSSFGVILQEPKNVKTLRVNIKFWLEDQAGVNMREWIAEEHTFRTAGDKCIFHLGEAFVNWAILHHAYDSHQSVSFCCELKLSAPFHHVQTPKVPDEFRQKLWEHYNAGLETDVTIKAGNRKFMVSRTILTSQCDVFNKMLSSNCKEGVSKTIEPTGFDVETIECFIKWLYLGVIEPEHSAEKLFLFADKYLIQELKDQCTELMLLDLTDDNVIERLILSTKFKSEQLKNAAFDFIALKSKVDVLKLFVSDSWRNFMNEDKGLADQILKELYAKL